MSKTNDSKQTDWAVIKFRRNSELEERLKKVQSWKDWNNLQKVLFGKPWEPCDVEQTELELEREEVSFEGTKWYPFSYPYKIEADTIDQFEDAQVYVFSRLDPQGHSENLRNPHWFGKKYGNKRSGRLLEKDLSNGC